jgi:hypothetical protein
MYKPKNQEKHEKQELGGVVLHFAGERFEEARVKASEFVQQGPFRWITENQPVRKAVLLEGLEFLRPAIEVSHEHEIEKWRKTR